MTPKTEYILQFQIVCEWKSIASFYELKDARGHERNCLTISNVKSRIIKRETTIKEEVVE